jgi:hypothetical protein
MTQRIDRRVVDYYLLCSVQLAPRHVVNDINANDISKIFTPGDLKVLFRKTNDIYNANEVVIGGKKEAPIQGDLIVII